MIAKSGLTSALMENGICAVGHDVSHSVSSRETLVRGAVHTEVDAAVHQVPLRQTAYLYGLGRLLA